ncbi:MAG: hypothetical protein EB062_03655, partial [Actinobacteria bacterium]|nr:hypothetical protein [Actinomycetota bacterium]
MARNNVTTSSVTNGAFSAQVSAITSAFGDPTRRAVYLFVRESRDGATAAQVAKNFDVHPNVARHHLDKLTAGGYLEVQVARDDRTGAGRPSKRYLVVASSEPMQFPVRSDDLVLSLLGRAIERLPRHEAEKIAEEVGRQYGQVMAAGLVGDDEIAAGQRSLRSALQKVADALTAHGFAAHTEQRQNKLRIINNHCPFGDVAIEHPVICAVDRGAAPSAVGRAAGRTLLVARPAER